MKFYGILSTENVLRTPFLKFKINVTQKVYIIFRNFWYEILSETPAFRMDNENFDVRGPLGTIEILFSITGVF